jgi:hypothetical protein
LEASSFVEGVAEEDGTSQRKAREQRQKREETQTRSALLLAADVRRSPPGNPSTSTRTTPSKDEGHVHLGELSSGSVGDLLDSELGELGLELDQLLGEVGLVLGDELVSADFAGGGRHGDYNKVITESTAESKTVSLDKTSKPRGKGVLNAKFPAPVRATDVCWHYDDMGRRVDCLALVHLSDLPVYTLLPRSNTSVASLLTFLPDPLSNLLPPRSPTLPLFHTQRP